MFATNVIATLNVYVRLEICLVAIKRGEPQMCFALILWIGFKIEIGLECEVVWHLMHIEAMIFQGAAFTSDNGIVGENLTKMRVQDYVSIFACNILFKSHL